MTYIYVRLLCMTLQLNENMDFLNESSCIRHDCRYADRMWYSKRMKKKTISLNFLFCLWMNLHQIYITFNFYVVICDDKHR